MNEHVDMNSTAGHKQDREVAVVGGGLAGLVAAITAANEGASVTLFEGSSTLGGRAHTTTHKGFHINMGPHALYVAGAARRILASLGVDAVGAMPILEGSSAIFQGKSYLMPLSMKSILLSRFLRLRDKIEVMGFYRKLPELDPADYRYVTQKEFVHSLCGRARSRHFVNAMCRLGTYSNAPDLLSADVVISQFKIGMSGVLYLDKGWQTLVDALADKARAVGVKIVLGEKVKAFSPVKGGVSLSLNSQAATGFDASILCVPPKVAAALSGQGACLATVADEAVTVRAACLELALDGLPDPQASFALGMDEATYFSVHSNTAELAPAGGALIQAAIYLGPNDEIGQNTRSQIEALVSKMQPGWQNHTVHEIYRPQAQVCHMLPLAQKGGLKGRPKTQMSENIYIAGDWVGEEGLLSDAAVASAHLAGKQAAGTVELKRQKVAS